MVLNVARGNEEVNADAVRLRWPLKRLYALNIKTNTFVDAHVQHRTHRLLVSVVRYKHGSSHVFKRCVLAQRAAMTPLPRKERHFTKFLYT